jgi:hypothetical protein
MKRIFLSLTVLLMFISATSFASDVTVPNVIVRSFESTFVDAKNVSWKEADGFTIASFTSGGTQRYAYYSESGELVVVAQPISINELTDGQKVSLQKNYEKYTITEVYKLENSEGTRHYVVVESSDRKLILCAQGNKWEVTSTKNK